MKVIKHVSYKKIITLLNALDFDFSHCDVLCRFLWKDFQRFEVNLYCHKTTEISLAAFNTFIRHYINFKQLYLITRYKSNRLHCRDRDFLTFERRTNSIPNAETTAAMELTESQFHVKKGLMERS